MASPQRWPKSRKFRPLLLTPTWVAICVARAICARHDPNTRRARSSTLTMVPSSSPITAVDPLADLVTSMPAAYTQIFERRDVVEHLAIINARGSARAHAAEWRQLPGGTAIVCVIADDVPGLLSLVSAAFVSHHLDVTSAQIFCRNTSRGVEAIDFFW